MDRYVVIDGSGLAANVVLWDGEEEWAPPPGCTAVLEDSDEGRAAIAAADAAAVAEAEAQEAAAAAAAAEDAPQGE